jgi:hypothetical protein
MNADFLLAQLKEAGRNALRSASTRALEDFAENFSADDLAKLITIMQNVEKKKRGTLDAKGSTFTR